MTLALKESKLFTGAIDCIRLHKAEYEVTKIKDHCERQGEMQYLTLFTGFDSSEDMWLSTVQFEHAAWLL